ncbi:MAG: GntR family transcriptional regulator [Eubacteriales bacterium]
MKHKSSLYMELLDFIRIQSKESDRLPTEEEMAKHFGVSRVKLRDALAALQNNGYIMRKKGAGTRINPYILKETARLDIDVFFEELITDSGFTPSTFVHKIKALRSLPAHIQKRLEVKEGQLIYQIEKTIYADGVPAIFLVDYLPSKYYNHDEIDLNLLARSTFLFVENHCEQLVDNLIVHIHAIAAQDNVAETLNLESGAPVLLLSSVSYNQSLKPIMYSQEYYNTELLPLSFQKRIILSKQPSSTSQDTE